MANTKWVLDPTHSEIQFKVKHLMISNVTGSFNVINATVDADGDNFNKAAVSFTADVSSVDTGNEQRDGHLKQADFFDTEKYPSMSFEAKEYNAATGKLSGNLTIKDVTRPVILEVEFNGVNKDPWGNEKAGFSLTGKINRKDWGLGFNAVLETGGALLSEDVRINAEVQLVKQAA
jgi:polyisoprenoid-binding protein YceI